MALKTLRLSESQKSLDRILAANGELAKKLTEAIDRSMLHGYRTGRRKPRVEEAALLHDLTKGDVAAGGWTTREEKEIEVSERTRAPHDEEDPASPPAAQKTGTGGA